MSDTGLYGSVYDQLRTYADGLDRALIALRNPQPEVAQAARFEIARLLRVITDRSSTDPAVRFAVVILRQELPPVSGKGLELCESLAAVLERRPPDPTELGQLEQVAAAIDKECSSTLARITGRR